MHIGMVLVRLTWALTACLVLAGWARENMVHAANPTPVTPLVHPTPQPAVTGLGLARMPTAVESLGATPAIIASDRFDPHKLGPIPAPGTLLLLAIGLVTLLYRTPTRWRKSSQRA